MKDFAAIDFETANGQRSSICSVGLVVVRDGEITIRHYRLVRPYPNYYNYWNTQVHGMSFQDTAHAAPFPEVWREIIPLIEGLPLVAHNRPFDEGCLKAAWLPVPLHPPRFPSCIRPGLAQPSTANSSPPLRIRPDATPSCLGRCGSVRQDCPENPVTTAPAAVQKRPSLHRKHPYRDSPGK